MFSHDPVEAGSCPEQRRLRVYLVHVTSQTCVDLGPSRPLVHQAERFPIAFQRATQLRTAQFTAIFAAALIEPPVKEAVQQPLGDVGVHVSWWLADVATVSRRYVSSFYLRVDLASRRGDSEDALQPLLLAPIQEKGGSCGVVLFDVFRLVQLMLLADIVLGRMVRIRHRAGPQAEPGLHSGIDTPRPLQWHLFRSGHRLPPHCQSHLPRTRSARCRGQTGPAGRRLWEPSGPRA